MNLADCNANTSHHTTHDLMSNFKIGLRANFDYYIVQTKCKLVN